MSEAVRAHQEAFGVRIPFVEHLGFQMAFFDQGQSELHFTPKPEHLNSFEVAHGGAIMTLLDVSMATAARSVDKASGVVTIEMKTSFMRPAQGPLVAKGRLITAPDRWLSPKPHCLTSKAACAPMPPAPSNTCPDASPPRALRPTEPDAKETSPCP